LAGIVKGAWYSRLSLLLLTIKYNMLLSDCTVSNYMSGTHVTH
jgi:hypothetical protein